VSCLPTTPPSALLLRTRSRRRRRRTGSPRRSGGAGRRRRAGSSLPLGGVSELEGHVERVHRRSRADRDAGDRREIRLLEERIALDVLHEVGDGVGIQPATIDRDHAAAHAEVIEPDQIRKILADLIHDAHRALLALLEVVDQIDALLQAVLALLILLDFLDDGLEALRLGLFDGDGLLSVSELALLEEPPSAADQDAENQTADDQNVVQVAGSAAGS